MRHLYYLEIPYLNGDPTTSFEADPERLQTQEEWGQFLETKNVGYVVRSPENPAEIERPLVEMEKSGYLVPYAEAEVRNLEGMRINQKRVTEPVVILRVTR